MGERNLLKLTHLCPFALCSKKTNILTKTFQNKKREAYLTPVRTSLYLNERRAQELSLDGSDNFVRWQIVIENIFFSSKKLHRTIWK